MLLKNTCHFPQLAIWGLFGGLDSLSTRVFCREKLSMTGSSTIAPLSLEIAKLFRSQSAVERISLKMVKAAVVLQMLEMGQPA
jgi:hypothetical protein